MRTYDQQIVIDLEFTTTTNEAHAAGLGREIIEIGAIRLDAAGNEVDAFSSFVRPEHTDAVADKVTSVTGIRTCDVVGAPCFESALANLVEWIGDEHTRIVAWSKSDRKQIEAECAFKRLEIPIQMRRWLDLQVVYPRIMGIDDTKRHMSLRDAADWYGTGLDSNEAHRALYDAKVTAKMMGDLMSGEYLEQKKALEDAIPLRKKDCPDVLSSNIGTACTGLAELKAALLASENKSK